MVNISSKAEARKRIREAQNKANGERAARERQTADDTATLVVALDRLKAVDQWEQNRIGEVRAEADRRRHQHHLAGAAALARMQGRGETLAAIAELAGVSTRELGATLKAAPVSSRQPEALREAPAGDGAQAPITTGNGDHQKSCAQPVSASLQGR
jgi:hypothetical protein